MSNYKELKLRLGFAAGGILSSYIVDKVLGNKLSGSTSGLLTGAAGLGFGYYRKDKRFNAFALGSVIYAVAQSVKQANAEETFTPDDTIIIGGEHYDIDTKGLFDLVDYTENPGFDLSETGHFNARTNRPVSFFVLHHGGYDLQFLADVFKNRRASTHFGIGLNPDGSVTVAQYLDTDNLAWHTENFNSESIGIDFAISPLPEEADRYGLPIVPFPKGDKYYGLSEITELPDSMVKAAIQLLKELHRIYGLKMKINPNKDRLYSKSDVFGGEANDFTVFGHQNFASDRFDPVYLWDRLLEEAND
jgi:hypothetical protein